MYKFPEILNFRVPAGTTMRIHACAEAEGKKVSTFVREAVEEFIKLKTQKPE